MLEKRVGHTVRLLDSVQDIVSQGKSGISLRPFMLKEAD